MKEDLKENVAKKIGNKIDIVKKNLINQKKKKSPKQIRLEKMKAEMEALKKEIYKDDKKTINDMIKVVESLDYKKVLKDISKMTDDTFLLNKIIDFAVAQNEEVKGKFVKINELINSEEENDKKIYELMGYDYKEMMKLKEEEELAELEELEEEIEDENSEKEENSETVEIETTDSKEENKKENKNHFEEFTEETGY
jgi:A-kinase anchor protein 9